MKPVLSKSDFINRYLEGEFGNMSPSWTDPREFRDRFDPHERYHLRNCTPSGITFYDLWWLEVLNLWEKVPNERDFYVSMMAPTHLTVIQGEVWESPTGLYTMTSPIALPMREALRELTYHDRGLRAREQLRHFMNDKSYDWLLYLLKEYPGHVIEFSVYSRCWGTVPGHNTVTWEVRKY